MTTGIRPLRRATDLAGLLPTLTGTDRFRTVLRAIELSGLKDELTRGDVTLFAPSDYAFERLPDGMLARLFERPERVRALLERHLVAGQYHERDLIPFTRLPTRAGSELWITFSDDRDVLVDGVPVLTTDILAANGVAHELEGVLLPD
jgi:uncharacterized surface protein with fasciclin (FAS1) repeats